MAGPSSLNKLLVCPISSKPFQDPVLAEDGHTYERSAIEEFIRQNRKSLFTGQTLSIEHLHPNILVKRIVESYDLLPRVNRYEYTLNTDLAIVGQPICRTSTKSIFRARWLSKNEHPSEIALLRINGVRAKKEASFYVELTRHPHIVQTFGFVHENNRNNRHQLENTMLLVQEFAPCGNLYDLLIEKQESPTEKVLLQMFLQIVEAMIYLASNKIVHGDLACRNVLVFKFDPNVPDNNLVKITDFGLSRTGNLFSLVASNARTELDIVPVRYAAPEVLSNSDNPKNYTEKSDVYSMGVLMWEAYEKSMLPWAQLTKDQDVIQAVTKGEILPQPSSCNSSCWNIILKTWTAAPDQRPTFTDLKRRLTESYYRSDGSKSNNTARWRHTAPGICLEGPCTNQSCESFNQGYIIICIGLRKFDVFLDSDESTTKCPMCSRFVEIKACGFLNCTWRWSGIQQIRSKPPFRCGGEWKKAYNEYQVLNVNTSEETIWRQLILEAKPL